MSSQALVYHPEDGVIAPFMVDEYEASTGKQMQQYHAISTYGGQYTFYSRAGAEFWLACRAAIRGPGGSRGRRKSRRTQPYPIDIPSLHSELYADHDVEGNW